MNHWPIKRVQRFVLLLAASAAVLAFVLFTTAGSIKSTEIEGNNSDSEAGGQDYEEVFSATTDAYVYIDWLVPNPAFAGLAQVSAKSG